MSALPKQLLYQNKVDAMGARPYTSNMQPQGAQTYTTNDVMIVNIPCNRNTVLSPHDSYLKFSLGLTNGAAINTWSRLSKAGAHGFIQRIRLFHGSTLLEDVDNYANLVAQLCTHQRSSDNVAYKGSVVEGFSEEVSVSINAIYNLNALRGARLTNTAYGAGGGAGDIAANAVVAPFKTFCIPLVSIIGSLGDKYIPLFAMTSSPLRLEIQLVSSVQQAVVSLTAWSTFSISNVEFIGSFIELSDQALAVIQQSQQGAPLTMAVNRWSNLVYNAQLQNAVTNVSCPVPFKYSSVQCIMNTIRGNAAGVTTFDAYGSNHYNINEYWYQFGSESLPTKHPGSSTTGTGDHQTMFNYYCSALGSPYALDYNPLVSLYTYDTMSIPIATAETPNTTAQNLTSIAGAFGIGQELVSFPSANQDQMFSGRNTSTEDIYMNLIFAANGAAPAVRFDFYCLHHAVIICENGQASIRY
jgi:hypothetical protein